MNSRPLVPVNPEGLDDIAAALLRMPNPGTGGDGKKAPENPTSYIILKGKQHGSYSYPDLYVCMHRLGFDNKLQPIAKKLNLKLQNTAKEQQGNGYMGSINWKVALTLNQELRNITLNPRQLIDLKEQLEKGIDGSLVIQDGTGKNLNDKKPLIQMYNEIFEVRAPWRSEWLDSAFVLENGAMYMNYNHRLKDGTLKAEKHEPLEVCVGKNDWIDITSFNRQGLPTRTNTTKKMYFYSPGNGTVARFLANSGGADLGCLRYPEYAGSSLGVRAAREIF